MGRNAAPNSQMRTKTQIRENECARTNTHTCATKKTKIILGYDSVLDSCNSSGCCNVVLLKTDIQVNQEGTRHYGIRALPTFVLFKDEQVVDRMAGANKSKLIRLINKHKEACAPKMAKLSSMSALNQTIQNAGDKLVVVNFCADWCSHCVAVEPSKYIFILFLI